MARNLVIVESPAKAKTIGKFLGKGFQVQASMGHVRDLPEKVRGEDIGVDVNNDFKPTYQVLTDMGYEVVGSRAGIYLWVKVGDAAAATGRLLERGVVVSPGPAFGPGGEGFIRLALVPTLEDCVDAVEVLKSCLSTET